MPALSRSAAGLLGASGDDGWGIYIEARKLAAAGHPVWNLAVGDHDTRTDQRIVEALTHAAETGPLGYAPVTGTPALRAMLAERASRFGPRVGPEGVQLTMGGQAALAIALELALDEGDECLRIGGVIRGDQQALITLVERELKCDGQRGLTAHGELHALRPDARPEPARALRQHRPQRRRPGDRRIAEGACLRRVRQRLDDALIRPGV
ncbi:MAG: hypothetical protein AAGE83_15455, partial [Pseudomonadota bacterium]